MVCLSAFYANLPSPILQKKCHDIFEGGMNAGIMALGLITQEP